MENLYTHIYDLQHGEEEYQPIAVAVGPRTTEYGTIYKPSGPNSKDNAWPGAEYPVIEYKSLKEFREGTKGLETWFESFETGQQTGIDAVQLISIWRHESDW